MSGKKELPSDFDPNDCRDLNLMTIYLMQTVGYTQLEASRVASTWLKQDERPPYLTNDELSGLDWERKNRLSDTSWMDE